MNIQTISIILNVALCILLIAVVLKARARLVEEKLATFAGSLNAMTFGLAVNDPQLRWDRLATGLRGMVGKVTMEEVRWRILRASMMRSLRTEPVAADLGEHLHALSLECMRGDEEAERIWAYIDSALANEPGFEQEPGDQFTAAELAKGQLQVEAELYAMYRASIAENPPKLFR